VGQGFAAGRLTVLRFDDIGDRLKAFRLGSGLTADEVAKQIGISRTALYRFEKGEVAKIETLEKLAELLDVSVPTLLGVGVEYVSSAVSFFERLRQIEETSEHITVLAGPVSLLLASDAFDAALEDVLTESIPADQTDRASALREIADLMPILRARKSTYRARKPGILNLISGAEIDRFLRNGLVGRLDLADDVRAARRAQARAEAAHLAEMMADALIGVQIGIVPGTLPHMSFQIFRQPDRKVLALSPFRLGEQPNVLGGIAMITSAPEALSLHERAVEDMWRRALKGQAARDFLTSLIARHPA
jgi:transcriptional regulator with XRE-family HTH domain